MTATADTLPVERLILVAAAAMDNGAAELTRLDRAIGDADHGTNMKRGFDALRAIAAELADMPWPDELERAGRTLVLSIGGAAGPLYGSLLLGMGEAARDGASVAEQVATGVARVGARGRTEAGAKTLLDVLIPVSRALAERHPPRQIRTVADAACESTRAMVATRGRAAFLGERSRGHIDPGAASSRLLVQAICDVLEEEQ